jgi:hypothetical protein
LNKKKNNKKNSFEVKIVNGEIVIRIMRDNMPFYLYETAVRKKIYHAPDFGVTLPETLNLEHVQSLSPRDRLQYLSDPDILPQECVTEFMTKLGQHLLDPKTHVKAGTLGRNGETTNRWDEPMSVGKHAFNPITGNDVFFNENGFKFQTGMNLGENQLIDLEYNDNIL